MKMAPFVLLFLASVGIADGNPSISIDQVESMSDQPISIVASNLIPFQQYTVRAVAQDPVTKANWESFADFYSDSNGKIDLGHAKAISGTYNDIDAMGLFWSMLPVQSQDPTGEFFNITDSWKVQISVESLGKPIVSKQITRKTFDDKTLVRVAVQSPVFGSSYTPRDFKSHAAVLVLGGSEGGTPDFWGALIASHGYTTLSITYFMPPPMTPTPPLTTQLIEIPLEYFKIALEWLRSQPGVDPNKVYVMGGSKGGELAVLLASTFPEYVKGAISYSGSGVVYQGIATKPPYQVTSSWTLNGVDVPYLKFDLQAMPANFWTLPHYSFRPAYEGGLKDAEKVAKAMIPVERMNGPILLFSGEDDQLWPSAILSSMIVDRLKANNFSFAVDHINYQGAGHGIMSPYVPAIGNHKGQMDIGGLPQPTAMAAIDAWNRAMKFLNELATKP